jgi:endonuclease-3 related protein
MKRELLLSLFRLLYDAYGPQDWWPGDGALEVVVGAILTQRTSWTNAERALDRLRHGGALSLSSLRSASSDVIEEAVRPAGCYREKAKKLKRLAEAVEDRTGGDLSAFLALPMDELRRELLAIHGIGPETADAILLYATERPSFVVDAYTMRLFERLGGLEGDESYDAVRDAFMRELPHDVTLFNEFHALIVRHGKTHCRVVPACAGCPTGTVCAHVRGGDGGTG